MYQNNKRGSGSLVVIFLLALLVFSTAAVLLPKNSPSTTITGLAVGGDSGFNINAPIGVCQTISSSGEYNLTSNVTQATTCLNITVSDVILDCGGFSIIGSSPLQPGAVGVEVNKAGITNVTILNCRIEDWEAGIKALGMSQSTIKNNILFNNTLANSGSSTSDLAVDGGVYLGDTSSISYNNIITNNAFLNNSYGLKIIEAENTTTTNNNFSNILGSGGTGLLHCGVNLSLVQNNLFQENLLFGAKAIFANLRVSIDGNNFTNNTAAIFHNATFFSTIQDNFFTISSQAVTSRGNNNNISTNNVTNVNAGVNATGTNQTIFLNRFFDMGSSGDYDSAATLLDGLENEVRDNNITNVTLGILLLRERNSTVQRNNITNASRGILVDVTIPTANTTTIPSLLNTEAGLRCLSSAVGNQNVQTSQRNTIKENLINATSVSSQEGVRLGLNSQANGQLVFNNTIKNIAIGTIIDILSQSNLILQNLIQKVTIGAAIVNGTQNNITSNNIFNTSIGVLINGSSSNNLILSNTIQNTSSGVGVFSNSNETVQNNTISGTVAGVNLTSTSNNTIVENSIFNNTYAVFLSAALQNTIANNTLFNNSYGLFFAASSTSNTITRNIVENNSIGINITGGNTGNDIYDNKFNNTLNAQGLISNNWNVTYSCIAPSKNIVGGPVQGGNFWSDYAGADDGTGGVFPRNLTLDYIGDTFLPHNVSNNISVGDSVPLIEVANAFGTEVIIGYQETFSQNLGSVPNPSNYQISLSGDKVVDTVTFMASGRVKNQKKKWKKRIFSAPAPLVPLLPLAYPIIYILPGRHRDNICLEATLSENSITTASKPVVDNQGNCAVFNNEFKNLASLTYDFSSDPTVLPPNLGVLADVITANRGPAPSAGQNKGYLHQVSANVYDPAVRICQAVTVAECVLNRGNITSLIEIAGGSSPSSGQNIIAFSSNPQVLAYFAANGSNITQPTTFQTTDLSQHLYICADSNTNSICDCGVNDSLFHIYIAPEDSQTLGFLADGSVDGQLIGGQAYSSLQNITYLFNATGRHYLEIVGRFNESDVNASKLKINATSTKIAVNSSLLNGTDSGKTLFLPNTNYGQGISFCPNAETLDQVNSTCLGFINFTNSTSFPQTSGNITVSIQQRGNYIFSEYVIENSTSSGAELINQPCGNVTGSTNLTRDVNSSGTCYVLQDNSTLNCAGNTILGDGTGVAIAAYNVSNVSVINCRIENFFGAILLSNINQALLLNNTLINHSVAISADTSTNFTIDQNNITNVNDGIYLVSTNQSNITSNIFNNTVIAVTIDDSYQDNIFNNLFSFTNVSLEMRQNFNNSLNGTFPADVGFTNASFINATNSTAGTNRIIFISNITLTSPTTPGQRIQVAFNSAFVNSTELAVFNTSADIEFDGLINITNPEPIVDFNDDGTFEDCSSTTCTELSFGNNTYIFNVTSFTTYSSTETLPIVTALIPAAGTNFNLSNIIEIGANVSTINANISVVLVNITFPNSTVQQLTLTNISANITDNKFNTSFTIPSTLQGRYDILFIANDTAGNLNTAETTFFYASNGCTISGSTLTNTNCTNSTITTSNKINVTLINSVDINSTVINSNETNTSVIGSNVTGSTLTNSNITNSNITGSNITNSNITGSTVNNSVITNSTKINSTLINSTITGSLNTNCTFLNSTEISSTCTNSIVNNSIISSSTISNYIVNSANITNDYCYSGTIIFQGITYTCPISLSNIPTPSTESTSPTSGGGGGGGASYCAQKWTCGEWSECNSDSIQTRNCFDINDCLNKTTIKKTKLVINPQPSETQSCQYAPRCDDQLKNQDETDVDCGGKVCPSCQLSQTCLIDQDCTSGNCFKNYCRPLGVQCFEDADCPLGFACEESECLLLKVFRKPDKLNPFEKYALWGLLVLTLVLTSFITFERYKKSAYYQKVKKEKEQIKKIKQKEQSKKIKQKEKEKKKIVLERYKQDLAEFIKQANLKGHSKEQIKQSLKQKSWPPKITQKYINKIYRKLPQTKIPKKTLQQEIQHYDQELKNLK